jgi:hypothetical protein
VIRLDEKGAISTNKEMEELYAVGSTSTSLFKETEDEIITQAVSRA